MNCSPGKLRALIVVPECQNRPSGETSHSNWWLCIRHMHFRRGNASSKPSHPSTSVSGCHVTTLPLFLLSILSFPNLLSPLFLHYTSVLGKNYKQLKRGDIVHFCWLQQQCRNACFYKQKTAPLSHLWVLQCVLPQPARGGPFERQGADRGNGCIVLVFITKQHFF